MRIAGSGAVLLCCCLAVGTAAPAQDTLFVAPKPQGAAPAQSPRAQSAPRSQASRQERQPRTTAARAPAPTTQCEVMTKDWIDFRPVQDAPARDGRTTLEQQQAAVIECQAEQQRQPSNKRIAFVFARTLEVNGSTSRAAKLYQQLAASNYPPAMTQLAKAYFVGAGVPRDAVEACTRYVQAARAGDAWAYNIAADCLTRQTATPDTRQACRYYRQAVAAQTLQTTATSEADYCG